MSLRPNSVTEETSGPPGEQDEALLLAESTPVPDLPGWFKKTVVVGPEETGFLTSNGSIIQELSSGSHKAGWSFMGWGSSRRAVVILHNRPFRLRLHFTNLLSKGYETLEAIVHITASLSAPSLFYSTVLRGRDGLNSTKLASTIAAGIDDLIQVKVAETHGQALRHDRSTQDQIMRELEPHLKRTLEERGLTLQSVDLAAFNNPEEGGELLDEIAEAEDLIRRGVKPGREDIQSLLNRLRSSGLATPEMAERALLLFDGGTNEAFFNVMKDIGTASRRRLEARVVDRSEQLSERVNAQESAFSRAGSLAKEKALTFIGPICGIVGLLYKFVGGVAGGWIALGVGLGVGAVFIAGYFIARRQRLQGLRKQDEIVIRLDRWVKQSSLETDDLIRRQMGREFSNSLTDVKEAKLAAHRQERRTVADALSDLENRMDLMRTEVEAAPAASTIVSAKGFPTRRISRMITFEEEMLRQARNLSIRSQTARESLSDDDVAALRTGLEHFQRTFSKRLGLLEGFKEL